MMTKEELFNLISDTYYPHEIIEALDLPQEYNKDLVEMFENEILERIYDTGEFGEASRLNELIREAWLPEDEEDPDEMG